MKIKIIFFSLLLTSCSALNIKTQCNNETAHTVLQNEQYKILIYSPDSLSNPSIWEGPICIEDRKNMKTCEFSDSLIKSVKFSSNESISIVSFSGSNSEVTDLNIANCSP